MTTKQLRKPAATQAAADTAAQAAHAAAWPFPTSAKRKPVERDTAAALDGDEPRELEPFGERIQAQDLRLYTDPSRNQLQLIAIEQLLEAPYNARDHYDQQALEELAETIRGVGVIEPILVRPVDLQGAAIARDGEALQAYEIIFGHRRYRAAKIAGEAHLPAFVRDLTQPQAVQLQAIENVQREDLKPLEEARAYQQYLQAHGVSKDQLAKEIGLSRSHVYSRLKLLTLPEPVQAALRAGEIDTEVAGYLARLHTPKIQEKALAAIKGKYLDMDDGGKKSVRQIRELLAEKYTLKLSEAIFDTEDAQLLDGADACTACPKRTGNAPEYTDLATDKPDRDRHGAWFRGGPNLCTDPDCFEGKKKAHLKAKAEALEAKGKTVITGNKARNLVSATGDIKEGYVALKDVKAELAKATKGKDAPAVQTVLIQDPRGGKTIEVVKTEDLKAAGVKVKKADSPRGHGSNYQAQQRQYEEDRRKRIEAADARTRVNVATLGAVRRAAAGAPLSTLALQLAAAAALKGVGYNEHKLIAELHGCQDYRELQKNVGSMPPDRLATLLLDCALMDDVIADIHDPQQKPEPLLAAAKHYGVDVARIRREVEAMPADVKTLDLLQGAEPTATPDPAGARALDAPIEPIKTKAAAKKPARKARISTGDAKQGIADAMQGVEGAGAATPAQVDLVDAATEEEGKPGAADAAQDEEASAAATALATLVDQPAVVFMLQGAGITTIEQLAGLDAFELAAITGQDADQAGDLVMRARNEAQVAA